MLAKTDVRALTTCAEADPQDNLLPDVEYGPRTLRKGKGNDDPLNLEVIRDYAQPTKAAPKWTPGAASAPANGVAQTAPAPADGGDCKTTATGTGASWQKIDVDDVLREHGADEVRHHFDADVTKPVEPPDDTSGGGDEQKGRARQQKGRQLELNRLSAVTSVPVQWLWPDRIPRKVVLFTGPPDVGKTLSAIDIAARTTRAAEWPDGSGRAPRGNVVILTAEDGIADTIRPRAEAAGADLDRIHYLRAVLDANGHRSTFSLQSDLAQLRECVTKIGDVVMAMIDPVTAYFGAGKIDTHKTSDVRAIMSLLTEFADELTMTILGITHPPKSLNGNAMNAATGSLAFIAAARSAYLFSREDESDRTLMLPIKNNLGPRKDGLAFRINVRVPDAGGCGIAAPYINWDREPVTITANEVLATQGERTDRKVLNEAMDFIRTELLRGEAEATVVQEQARKAGISNATYRRARDELKTNEGLKTRREGFGREGKFFLSLPIDAHDPS
jgi:putative DNA primase/helicase